MISDHDVPATDNSTLHNNSAPITEHERRPAVAKKPAIARKPQLRPSPAAVVNDNSDRSPAAAEHLSDINITSMQSASATISDSGSDVIQQHCESSVTTQTDHTYNDAIASSDEPGGSLFTLPENVERKHTEIITEDVNSTF